MREVTGEFELRRRNGERKLRAHDQISDSETSKKMESTAERSSIYKPKFKNFLLHCCRISCNACVKFLTTIIFFSLDYLIDISQLNNFRFCTFKTKQKYV